MLQARDCLHQNIELIASLVFVEEQLDAMILDCLQDCRLLFLLIRFAFQHVLSYRHEYHIQFYHYRRFYLFAFRQ